MKNLSQDSCYTNLLGDNFYVNKKKAVTRKLRVALGVLAINNVPLEKMYMEARRVEIYIFGIRPVFVG
jgi:hypothetical protein